jgi:hypothetical protein
VDDATKVPPTDEETIPAMQEEFERLAKDALRVAGACVPWADAEDDQGAFDEQIGRFGRLLAETVAARPRPAICDQWTVLVDLRRVGPGGMEKVREGLRNTKLSEVRVGGGPDERPIVLFFPLLVRRGNEAAGSALLRSKYAATGELVSGVAVVMDADAVSGTRTAVVTRISSRGYAHWWSRGPMAGDRSTNLGPWTEGAPRTAAERPVKVNAVGSSMLN